MSKDHKISGFYSIFLHTRKQYVIICALHLHYDRVMCMCYEMERNAKKMLQTIEQINNVVNNFIWGVPAMICIIGVGLFLSVRTRFLQIRKFPYAMKVTIGRMLKRCV